MILNSNYIAVERVYEPEKEGFQTVEVMDPSIFKGKVTHLPGQPVYLSNDTLSIGDIVLFAKYSPDTHEITIGDQVLKFINTRDLLAKL